MSEQKPIDIMQEFVDLYGKEEMLAFFDFSIERPGGEAIAGLCRISRPRSSGAKMQYLSLTFVADTPDEDAREAIATALERIDADRLRRAVAEVAEVVSMPGMGDPAQTYVAQTDILLDRVPDEQFIALRLLPAIRRLMQVKPTEVVWWAQSATPGKPSARPAVPAESHGSLVNDIRSYLSKNFRGDSG